jgi:spermidine synthase
MAAGELERVLRAGRLEFYEEGPAGTVSVRRVGGTLSLAIDGKVDASNGGDMLTQRVIGLLPLLLHGRAQDVGIVGLGSGVTVGAALAAGGVRHADVVELSPGVVRASRFFDRESGNPLARPGVRLIVGDGRSHLLLTPRRYDVIISEPSNPWMSGVATLFTREFFLAARARLKPGGVLAQWAQTYDLGAADLRSIAATFASVFPEGSLWLVGGGDLLLIGTDGEAIAPKLERLAREWRAGTAAAELADVGVTQASARFALLSLLAGGPRELARYGAGAPLQSDDHTALEYSAPRALYDRNKQDHAAAIRGLGLEAPPAVRELLERASAADWVSRGNMLLKAQAFGLAYDAFRRAVTLDARDADALAGLSDAAGGSSRLTEERDWLRELAERDASNAAVRTELSRVLAVTGDLAGAAAVAAEAVRLAPGDPRAGEQLASVLADAGEVERLERTAAELAARFPERIEPRYYRATALLLRGQTWNAILAARQVVAEQPGHARAQSLLGVACTRFREPDCAREAFQAAIRGNPRDPSPRINLGALYLQSGDAPAAAEAFADALLLAPGSLAARQGLAQARAAAH